MIVILITVLAQNNMSSKCFITFLNTTAQSERSDSNPRLQPRCLRSSHTSLLRRKVASRYPGGHKLCKEVNHTVRRGSGPVPNAEQPLPTPMRQPVRDSETCSSDADLQQAQTMAR